MSRWLRDAQVRPAALLRSGHGYMSLLPFALGVAAAVTLLSLALAAADAARGRRGRPLPAWAFALLPLVAFTVQEHLERWLSSGVFPWHAAAEPTFLPGLALQLPFGLLAYLAARLLLRAAEGVGRTLVQPAAPRPRFLPLPVVVPAAGSVAPPVGPAPVRLPRLLGVALGAGHAREQTGGPTRAVRQIFNLLR